jgi:hypothetical protein
VRRIYVCVAAAVAALALMAVPAAASAASPVLEFVPSSGSFPTHFEAEGGNVNARLGDFDRIVECGTSEGEGEITGARTTFSVYWFTGCVANPIGGGGSPLKCTTPDAAEEEIESEVIEADLVYLNQATHEVAMLLNPGGGVYMEFECGNETVVASGSFLSPVGPVNQLAPSFTAILERNGNSQTVTEYEDLDGVKHQAIPTAVVNAEPPDTSGVELAFAVQPSVPLEIKAVSAVEVEVKQHEEAKQREEAAAKRRDEEAAAKKHQEEEAATKRQEEETLAKTRQAEAEAKARKQKLTKALKQCNKIKRKGKRAQCKKRAVKKFGSHHA